MSWLICIFGVTASLLVRLEASPDAIQSSPFQANGIRRIIANEADEDSIAEAFARRTLVKSDLAAQSQVLIDAAEAVDSDIGEAISRVDFQRARRLPRPFFAPNESESAEMSHSIYFQGDILEDPLSSNAILQHDAKWPDARIPYTLSRRFSERERAVIGRAILDYEEKTCIRFVNRTDDDKDYVYIYPGNGCASQVGRAGGMQILSLGTGCTYVGIVEHEMMHTVGFWHEQSRADRDDYIEINWKNILPGMEFNFEKYTWKDIQHLAENYDYGSVMHYGPTAFSVAPNRPTIVPKTKEASIGQRNGLSPIDVRKINKLYDCNSYLKTWDSY